MGEKRQLTIPSHLAYGEAGAGEKIPGGAALKFDVECVSIEDGPAPVNVFAEVLALPSSTCVNRCHLLDRLTLTKTSRSRAKK